MFLPVASRLLLGLLCFNEFFRPEVTAASYLCRKMPGLLRGTIVETQPFLLSPKGKKQQYKSWCGQQSGQFLAVQTDQLFHLTCAGAKHLKEARGAILDNADQGARELTFEENEVCNTRKVTLVSNDNAAILARKLDNVEVPFDRQNCNVKHYLDYLTSGKVTAPVMERCPVHRAFDARYRIDTRSFQLAGKNGYYTWPAQDNIGALTFIASSRPRSPPKSAIPSRNKTSSPPKLSNGSKQPPARSPNKTAAWLKSATLTVARSFSGNGRKGGNGKISAVDKRGGSFGGASAGNSYGTYHNSAATRGAPLGGIHFPDFSSFFPSRNAPQQYHAAGGNYLG